MGLPSAWQQPFLVEKMRKILSFDAEQLERRKKPSPGCRQTQGQRQEGEEPLLLHS